MEDRISSFLSHHNIRIMGQSARSFIFNCPACGGDRKLYIDKRDGRSVCFKGKSDRCPKPGSFVSYALSLLSGLPMDVVKREILDFVVDLADEIRVSFDEEEPEKAKIELPSVMLPIDISFMSDYSSKEGMEYLESRGIPVDLQNKHSIMYSPSMRRVIFPVITDNKLCGWQGRAIDKVDHMYRMYNVPGAWKANTLMFYQNIINKDFAIVAEGPVSALKFAGVGNFVASMGKEISKRQIEILKETGIKRVYLALDRDAVDKLSSIRYNLKNVDIDCYYIPVPDHRDDFGDCTFNECVMAFEKARKLDGDDIFAYIEFKMSKYGH